MFSPCFEVFLDFADGLNNLFRQREKRHSDSENISFVFLVCVGLLASSGSAVLTDIYFDHL